MRAKCSCRIRHVKCDRTDPYCVRCRNSGFECAGYSAKHTRVPGQAKSPKMSKGSVPMTSRGRGMPFQSPSSLFNEPETDSTAQSAVVLRMPSQYRFEDESECRYFVFFRNRTAAALSGYLGLDFWGRVVLQLCHQEEFAMRAVVALAALNRTMDSKSIRSSQATNRHHTFALKQYGMALRLIRQNSTAIQDEYHLRNALISCLLTTCFECYHGNQEGALAQANSGIKLLSSFQERRAATYPHFSGSDLFINSPVIDSDLLATFARLENAVVMFCETPLTGRDTSFQSEIDTRFLNSMFTVFHSMKDARIFWDVLSRRSMHWRAAYSYEPPVQTLDPLDTESGKTLGISILLNTEVREDLAARLNMQVAMHFEAVSRWMNAFMPMFEKCRAKPKTTGDFQGATTLMLKYLAACLSLPEYLNQNILRDAISVVDMARDLLEPDILSEKTRNRAQAIFTFDDCLVGGLFLVATRCRDRVVRREALKLLNKHPRREGLWDGAMASRVAEWFVETEEEGLAADEEVAVDSRLVLLSNEFSLSDRKAVVCCSRTVNGEVIILPPAKLTW